MTFAERESALSPLEYALYELMSELSECRYCAGWMSGCEHAIWRLCESGEFVVGWGRATDWDIARQVDAIRALRDVTGRWIVWDEGPVAVTLADWARIVEDQ